MKFNTIRSILLLFLLTSFSYAQQNLDVFDVARKGTADDLKNIIKSNPKAINEINTEGYSPLILACYRGNNEVAKMLIEKGADIDYKSGLGSPLMACAVKGNNEMAKYLIEKKADLNAADANGTTALIYAVQFQNLSLIKFLIEHNVDKNHQDKKGKTAFEYAVFSNNEETINLLK